MLCIVHVFLLLFSGTTSESTYRCLREKRFCELKYVHFFVHSLCVMIVYVLFSLYVHCYVIYVDSYVIICLLLTRLLSCHVCLCFISMCIINTILRIETTRTDRRAQRPVSTIIIVSVSIVITITTDIYIYIYV